MTQPPQHPIIQPDNNPGNYCFGLACSRSNKKSRFPDLFLPDKQPRSKEIWPVECHTCPVRTAPPKLSIRHRDGTCAPPAGKRAIRNVRRQSVKQHPVCSPRRMGAESVFGPVSFLHRLDKASPGIKQVRTVVMLSVLPPQSNHLSRKS